MKDAELYSIEQARKLLGGLSRNSLYQTLRSGELPSVLIGCRRFISASAITDFISASTTRASPSRVSAGPDDQATIGLPHPHRPGFEKRKQETDPTSAVWISERLGYPFELPGEIWRSA